MIVLVTLTTAGADTGPFNLYSNLDGFSTPFETSVSKASLLAGYLSSIVPNGTTVIGVKSTSVLCQNEIYLNISNSPTTTTTTTTSTTTTPPPPRTFTIFGKAQDTIAIGPSAVAVYYKIGVGGTWTLVTLTPVTIGTVNTLITGSLIIPNGSDVYFGVRNVSFADISFGVGNGGGFVGFCGESAPYHYGIVSGNDSVYFNMAVVSNAFVTC